MTILTTCCCCLTLKDGVAVLGWLGAVLSGLNIVNIIVALATSHHLDANISINLISMVLHCIVAVCLIKATQSKNKRLLLPWLVISIINLIFMNITTIMTVSHAEEKEILIISALLVDALVVYFWLCVYSYYQELDALV